MKRKLYQTIACKLSAISNCQKTDNKEWEAKHRDALDTLMEEMPSGSGIDCGTKLLDHSTPERLVFQADFHHMDENGYYDGWTEHQVIVTPSLQSDFTVRITGRNKNEIKEYLSDIFSETLNTVIE